MNFTEQLEAMAAEGRDLHHAAPREKPSSGEIVSRLRRARRARAGALAAAAVAVVALAAVLVPPRDEPAPLAAVPGQELWAASVDGEVWGEPAIAVGLAVIGDSSGTVSAFSVATGELVWSSEMGAPVRAGVVVGEVGGEPAFFVVADDGMLTRLGRDGSAAWSVDVGAAVGDRETYDQSSPALAIDDATGYIGGRDSMVRAIDLDTGAELWNVYASAPVAATAAVGNGVVVVGDLSGYLAAYEAATGARLWRHEIGDPIHSTPGIAGATAVTGSRGTSIVGLDVATGEERWSVSLGSSWAESSIEVDGDTVYAGSSGGGQVRAIDAATGDVAWTATVGGWPWARPTLESGVLYVTTAWLADHSAPNGSLNALDPATGSVLWDAEVGGESTWAPDGPTAGIMAPPATDNAGTVIVGALDGSVVAFTR